MGDVPKMLVEFTVAPPSTQDYVLYTVPSATATLLRTVIVDQGAQITGKLWTVYLRPAGLTTAQSLPIAVPIYNNNGTTYGQFGGTDVPYGMGVGDQLVINLATGYTYKIIAYGIEAT